MAKNPIRVALRKSIRGSQAALCIVNRLMNRFDDKLFVLGEGSSGTTWFANILNFDDHDRVLFEPFQT